MYDYMKWTYCHGFFQQNVVSFFCKSHRRLLEVIKTTILSNNNYIYTEKKEILEYSCCIFTLCKRSGVQMMTASANFSLLTTHCQSISPKINGFYDSIESLNEYYCVPYYMQTFKYVFVTNVVLFSEFCAGEFPWVSNRNNLEMNSFKLRVC